MKTISEKEFKLKISTNDNFTAIIDGQYCMRKEDLLLSLSEAFKFPKNNPSRNFDSLDEQLNDLSWINHNSIALFIINSNLLLSQEDNNQLKTLLSIFRDVSEEWNSVPNYFGEYQFRSKRIFEVFQVII